MSFGSPIKRSFIFLIFHFILQKQVDEMPDSIAIDQKTRQTNHQQESSNFTLAFPVRKPSIYQRVETVRFNKQLKSNSNSKRFFEILAANHIGHYLTDCASSFFLSNPMGHVIDPSYLDKMHDDQIKMRHRRTQSNCL